MDIGLRCFVCLETEKTRKTTETVISASAKTTYVSVQVTKPSSGRSNYDMGEKEEVR